MSRWIYRSLLQWLREARRARRVAFRGLSPAHRLMQKVGVVIHFLKHRLNEALRHCKGLPAASPGR